MTLLPFKLAVPDGIPRSREERCKEKLFLDHYSWLAACALNITHGQRERAEDLVHDVFLQFLDKDTDLASIADVRGYLNGILRHLHLLQLRQTTRHPLQSLSWFDHDSALVGLRARGSVDQLQFADLLLRACDFACYRKETALTASILILRFFHGYYPGEIALLLRAKRRTVDQWIQRGRSEMKQYIDFPYPLPEGNGRERKMPSAATPNVFLRLLRERVFDSCKSDCAVLAESSSEFGVAELSHLVSCRNCLEHRSRKAGLAYVAERMADDISDRDDGRPRGSGGSGSGEILPVSPCQKGSKRSLLRRLHARRRERFEHRPTEISLAFDGQIHATMLVNAPTNTLNLSLGAKEVPDSIAVLSEQEFHFFVLSHEELTCSERKVYRLALSDGRLMQVFVTPETLGPSIQLVYEDLLFSAASAELEGAEPETISDDEPVLRFPSNRADAALTRGRRWVETLRNLIKAMNPLLTSAIVLGAVALVCFVLWLRNAPTPSAGELLDHAQKSDRVAVTAKRPGVIYQKVAIYTAQRTVERTLYHDAQGIRRPRRQQLTQQDEQLRQKLESAGVNWDAPLLAVDFIAWRRQSVATEDAVTRSAPHLLTVTTTPSGNSAIIKETFTVRDTDFHAVDRTIDLRDSGTVEIAELNYDVLPWDAVNQDWFEPPATKTVTDAPGILSAPAPRLPKPLSDLEREEAEVLARITLNQLHADTGEQIFLATGASGVEVKGVVDTSARSQQLISHLSQLPHVRVSILSVEELRSHPESTSQFSVGQSTQVYSFEAQASPLERYMRDANQPLDRLASISQKLLDGALKVQQAEVNMSALQPVLRDADRLPIEYRDHVSALRRAHLNLANAAIDANESTLRSLGFDTPNRIATGSESAPLEEDLDQKVRAYQELCQELITGRSGRTRPAAVIATELIDVGERIRIQPAPGPNAVSTAHD